MSTNRPKTAPTAGAVPLPKMRRGPKAFYRDVVREMKHVHWPTRHESMRLTGVVIAICALVVGFLTALSWAFDTLFTMFIRKGA